MRVMGTRLVKCIALLTLTVSALLTVPASAAVQKPKNQVWVGQVQRHRTHFDYVGKPCPDGTGILCADYVAHYRIVALNSTARRALRRLNGQEARLLGRLTPARDAGHEGTLLVKRVKTSSAPAPPKA